MLQAPFFALVAQLVEHTTFNLNDPTDYQWF